MKRRFVASLAAASGFQ